MFNKPAYEELERQVRQLKRGAAHRERVEARIFSALVEHSVDAVLLTAPGGQIIFSNPAAHDLFQMTY